MRKKRKEKQKTKKVIVKLLIPRAKFNDILFSKKEKR